MCVRDDCVWQVECYHLASAASGYIDSMDPHGSGGGERGSAFSAAVHARQTIDTARRAVVVLWVVLGVCAAAIIVNAFIEATDLEAFDGAGSPEAKLQVARFLSAISVPLLLVAVVLALSVFATVHIARFELDALRADDALAQRDETALTITSQSTRRLQATAAPPEIDDSEWRPTGS